MLIVIGGMSSVVPKYYLLVTVSEDVENTN